MENSFQTSFIPKKPIVSSNIVTNRTSSTSLFVVLSVVILLVAGASAGGLFLYKNYLSTQIESLSSSLVKAQGNFDKDTISELELFDKRASAAKIVLNNHYILSPMFKLISDITLPTIQYTKFDHTTTEKGFVVKMSGIARDYRSVALQADVFNSAKGRSFKDVVFSNLTKNKNNYVLFDLEFSVDKNLLSFENNVTLDQSKIKTETQTTEPVQKVIQTTGQTETVKNPQTTQTSSQTRSDLPTQNSSESKKTTTSSASTTKPSSSGGPGLPNINLLK